MGSTRHDTKNLKCLLTIQMALQLLGKLGHMGGPGMKPDQTPQVQPSRLRGSAARQAGRSQSTGHSPATSLAADRAAQAPLCQNTQPQANSSACCGQCCQAGLKSLLPLAREGGQETDRDKRLLWGAPCGRGTAHCCALKALQGLKALGHHSAHSPLIPPELLLLRVVPRQCTTQRVQARTLLPHGTSAAHQGLQQLSRVPRVLQLEGPLKGDVLREPLRRHAQGSRPLLQAEGPAEPGVHTQDLTLTHLEWGWASQRGSATLLNTNF